MLSDTCRASRKGKSHVLGFHANAQRKLEKRCPVEKKKGKCVAFQREYAMRKNLARKMEDSLRSRAEELFTLQCELLHDACDEEEGEGKRRGNTGEEERVNCSEKCEKDNQGRNVSITAPPSQLITRNRACAIEQLILQLQREPEYKNWSLDAAVAKEMGEKGMRCCPYAHVGTSAHKGGVRTGESTILDAKALKQEFQTLKHKPAPPPPTPLPPLSSSSSATYPTIVTKGTRSQPSSIVLAKEGSTSVEEEKEKGPEKEGSIGGPSTFMASFSYPLNAMPTSSTVIPPTSHPTCSSSLTQHGRTGWRRPRYAQEWDERRRSFFAKLSPVQQAIVCLLWQQLCVVPLPCVCSDVRDALYCSLREALQRYYFIPPTAPRTPFQKKEEEERRRKREKENSMVEADDGKTFAGKQEENGNKQFNKNSKKRKQDSQEVGRGRTIKDKKEEMESASKERLVEEALDRYVNTEAFERLVEEASSTSFTTSIAITSSSSTAFSSSSFLACSPLFVLHRTSSPLPLGQFNVSFLPSLLCYMSRLSSNSAYASRMMPHSAKKNKHRSPCPSRDDCCHNHGESQLHTRSPVVFFSSPSSFSFWCRRVVLGAESEDDEKRKGREERRASTASPSSFPSSPSPLLPPSPPPVILPLTLYYFQGVPPACVSPTTCTFKDEGGEEEEEEVVLTARSDCLSAAYPPLLHGEPLTEKEINFSTPSHAEALVQCIEWLLFVYEEERRCCPPALEMEHWREKKWNDAGIEVASPFSLSTSPRGTCCAFPLPHTTHATEPSSNQEVEEQEMEKKKDLLPSSHQVHESHGSRSKDKVRLWKRETAEVIHQRRVLYYRLRYGLPISDSELQDAFPSFFVMASRREKTDGSYHHHNDLNKEKENHSEESSFSSIAPDASTIQMREFILQHCDISNADALISALLRDRTRGGSLSSRLLSLDLSHNRLHSLRFLYMIRQHQQQDEEEERRRKDEFNTVRAFGASFSARHRITSATQTGGFPRLIRLSLKNNAITQKPDYGEQVRCCLPKLMLLDGKKIRRAPLLLPFPVMSSFTTFIPPPSSISTLEKDSTEGFSTCLLTVEEGAMVMDYLERFMYIWETKRIPLTKREEETQKKAINKLGKATTRLLAPEVSTEVMNIRKDKSRNTTVLTKGVMVKEKEEVPSEKNNEGFSHSPLWSLPAQEERIDEDNFPSRYLHSECVFSFYFSPDVGLLNPSVIKLDRQVEMERMDDEEKKTRKRKITLEKQKKKAEQKRKRIKRERSEKMGPEHEDDTNDEEEEEEEEEKDENPHVYSAASQKGKTKIPMRSGGVVTLNAVDYRELQMFYVSMKNSSRNLLQGRQSLEQIARGASHCYLAYISTIYPERVTVNHHFGSSIVSWIRVSSSSSSSSMTPHRADETKGKKGKVEWVGKKVEEEQGVHYIVQLHGIMTWSLPSMQHQLAFLPPGHVLTAAFDRTMILVPRSLPPRQGRWFEQQKGHALVLKSDMLHLRAVPAGSSGSCSLSSSSVEFRSFLSEPLPISSSTSPSSLSSPPRKTTTTTRAPLSSPLLVAPSSVPNTTLAPCVGPAQQLSLSRLIPYVLAWGLDGGRDGDGFRVVREVAEQSGSEAALYASLDILVFRLSHHRSSLSFPPDSTSNLQSAALYSLCSGKTKMDKKWKGDEEIKMGEEEGEGKGTAEQEDGALAIKCRSTPPTGNPSSFAVPPLLYWKEENEEEERRRDEEEHEFVNETAEQQHSRRGRETAVRKAVCQRLAQERESLLSSIASFATLRDFRQEIPLQEFPSSPFFLRIASSIRPEMRRKAMWNPFSPPFYDENIEPHPHTSCLNEDSALYENHDLVRSALPSCSSTSRTCGSSCAKIIHPLPPAPHNKSRENSESSASPLTAFDGGIIISLPLLHSIVGIVNQHYVV